MTPEPRCSLGHWKAALAIPSSLAHNLGEDNLEMPSPVCTLRSEENLGGFFATALALVSRGEGIQLQNTGLDHSVVPMPENDTADTLDL